MEEAIKWGRISPYQVRPKHAFASGTLNTATGLSQTLGW